MVVTLRINGNCNLKCEYCVLNKGIVYKTTDIFETITNIKKMMKILNRKFEIYLLGGENSIHPDFIDILKYLRQNKIKVNFQTNLTMNEHIARRMIEYIDEIMISFHPKELLKRKKIDIFFNNLEIIYHSNVVISNLDIMSEGDLAYEYMPKLEKYITKSINSELVYNYMYTDICDTPRFSKTTRLYDFPELNIYQKSTNELFKLDPNFYGFTCRSGFESIFIEGNGDIFLCASHLTNYLNNNLNLGDMREPIGNINNLKESINIFKKEHLCKFNTCSGCFWITRYKKGNN